jgi:mycothione reductase
MFRTFQQYFLIITSFADINGNYESILVYYNALLERKVPVDYHAIPHAVFTYPEIAGVGMHEKEAIEKFGEQAVLIGYYEYENTAKGEAMQIKKFFVKVILQRESQKIIGAISLVLKHQS